MKENTPHLILDLAVGPIGVLTAQERGFVPPNRPIKPMRCPPSLLGRHAP